MQKILHKIYAKAPEAEADVLYRRKALYKVNRRDALDVAARKAARRIVVCATREAANQYVVARSEGYRDGLTVLVEEVANQIEHLSMSYETQLSDFYAAITADVERLFRDTETARALIEEYIEVKNVGGDESITVYVPRWCRLSCAGVDQLRTSSGRRIKLASSPSNRFVISNGRFSISFYPPEASSEISNKLVHNSKPTNLSNAKHMLSALMARLQPTDDRQAP
ncbi:hypothetical protein JOE11_003277 [Robbsia andropogonis]|uniref:hypothetical protein n=1 Tax=Robbsia andropogonis TaxID=28092 RepID=UPI003D197A06